MIMIKVFFFIYIMSIFIDNSATILNDTSNSLTFKTTANAANMEFKLGSNDVSTNIIVKDNQVVPGILHRIPASGQYLAKNSLHPKINLVSHNTEGPQTYSTTDVINGVITRDCNGESRTDIFPNASAIIASIPNCQVGSMFNLLIRNVSSGNHTVTLNVTATGITLNGDNVIIKDAAYYWTFIVTDVGGNLIHGYLTNRALLSTTPIDYNYSVQFNPIEELKPKLLTGVLTSNSWPLYRAGNGSGASDAWSISFWIKQTLQNPPDTNRMIFSNLSPAPNHGNILLVYKNNHSIALFYGDVLVSSDDYLSLTTSAGAVTHNVWTHLLVTYDGGTTGNDAVDINDYYSRFKIYINGANQSLTGSNSSNGYTAAMNVHLFAIGYYSILFKPITGFIDEFAIFNGDQSGNIADIYNNGIPHDMSVLGVPPAHYWRMTSYDINTFPAVDDHIGNINLAAK